MRILRVAAGAVAALALGVAAAHAQPLTVVEVNAPAVNCVFHPACTITVSDSVGLCDPTMMMLLGALTLARALAAPRASAAPAPTRRKRTLDIQILPNETPSSADQENQLRS